MPVRNVTGLVNAPNGQGGIDAPQINPQSGLHRNVWVTPTALDLSGSNTTVYGPVFPNNKVELQKVHVTVGQEIVTGQEAVLELGIVGDVNEFGTLDFETDAPWADGQAAGDITDASSFLLENESTLEAGEQLILTLTGDGDGGNGTVAVAVEYVILDDV